MKMLLVSYLPKDAEKMETLLKQLQPKTSYTLSLGTFGLDPCIWVIFPMANRASEAAAAWETTRNLQKQLAALMSDADIAFFADE